jgi:hypothetical protein
MNIMKGKMKTFIVIVAGIAALVFFATAASASSGSSIADAQKKVDKAQADLDKAKEKAELMMASSDKSKWREAEMKFESMVADDKDSKKIAAQEQMLKDLETRIITSSQSPGEARAARVNLDLARDQFVGAYAKLALAKAQARPPHQTISNDDSSQAIQPENRTQNGSNFSIRSQRDSENHPPLPASQ